jgi:hypothetical protein
VDTPQSLAAICWLCDQKKTLGDLKAIARAKRIFS